MPWSEVSVMDQRHEFVRLALQEGANRRELCRRFNISPDVGYKWLRRWQAGDQELGGQRIVQLERDEHFAVTEQRYNVQGLKTVGGLRALRCERCRTREGEDQPAQHGSAAP